MFIRRGIYFEIILNYYYYLIISPVKSCDKRFMWTGIIRIIKLSELSELSNYRNYQNYRIRIIGIIESVYIRIILLGVIKMMNKH